MMYHSEILFVTDTVRYTRIGKVFHEFFFSKIFLVHSPLIFLDDLRL